MVVLLKIEPDRMRGIRGGRQTITRVDSATVILRICAREGSAVSGALKLPLPQRPLDRVGGEASRSDHERQSGARNHKGVAPTVAPDFLEEADHLRIDPSR
jgi:hypothetical protein